MRRLIDLTDDLIRSAVSANAYAAGQAYMRAGRVRELQADADDNHISAAVKGSASRPYRLAIDVHRAKNGKVSIAGECTCPVGFNCKHVAAALLLHRQAAAAKTQPEPAIAEAAAARPAAYRMNAAAAAPQARSLADAPAPLGPLLTAWLRDLAQAAEEDSEEYPEGVKKRVFYLLSQFDSQVGKVPVLEVTPALANAGADGAPTGAGTQPGAIKLISGDPLPKYIRPSDRKILSALAAEGEEALTGDPALLRAILATGRARIGAFPGAPAREGAARPARLEWRMEADGTQRPSLTVDGGGTAVLLPSPWYVDASSGEVGPAEVDIPPMLLARLLSAPPVPPAQAAAVRRALSAALPSARLPAPRELVHAGELRGTPTPHLRLHRMQAPAYASQFEAVVGAGTTLRFRYGPALAPVQRNATELVHAGKRYTLTRNRPAEDAATAVLAKLGFRSMQSALPYLATPATQHCLVLPGRNQDSLWLDFMLNGVPALRAQGWEIEEDADFSYRLVVPTSPFHAELREHGSGIDWFDLDLGVMVGEERVDLVPPLVRMISAPDAAAILQDLHETAPVPGRKLMLELQDGRRMAVEMTMLRPILLTLFDLFGVGGVSIDGGRLAVARHGAAGVAGLEKAGLAAGLVWKGGDALRALGRLLTERGGIPEVKIPKWFAASLRPYQQRGVDWMQFLREAGLAGVLADDMGLGKTVQTLAHLAVEKQARRLTHPALVICPTSVVGNWAREAERFAPKLRVLTLQGSDRKSRFEDIPHSDLVISTYPLLARDDEILTAQEWSALILDEAQTVKNPAATMAQTVRRLQATQRICLTGTPMENHLGELWALFDFMMPGFLGSAQDFGRRFRTPIEKGGDAELHAALARRVSPFLLRRNKSEVATELPPRTEIVENVQMQASQRAVYEAVRLTMHARVQEAIAEKGLAKSGIVILDALLKMRQACCDPRLLKLATQTKHKPGSAKLDRLLELLTTLQEEGRSILLFSQFTSMLALIEDAIKPLGMPYVTLTGDTKDRRKPVDDFQAGKVRLFLISLKAGGVGLNLTAADTVIHYDPWWNPAVENQATDRAHRIGQTKSVFVHRLITENTIEEKMEALKARKSALADGILNGTGSGALRMTEDDVEMLFG